MYSVHSIDDGTFFPPGVRFLPKLVANVQLCSADNSGASCMLTDSMRYCVVYFCTTLQFMTTHSHSESDMQHCFHLLGSSLGLI
jgi:hypothetical protein